MLKILICWRLLWALLSQSWYVPDETWQSVEVAHKMAFGQGLLTWETNWHLRSSLQSLPYAGLFKLLQLLHLDFQFLVIYLPKMLAGVLTAIADWCFYHSAKVKYYGMNLREGYGNGRTVAKWWLLLSQTNWFLIYSGSRTVINTMETALLSIGVSMFPDAHYLYVVALSVMLRPTLAIAWAPMILDHFWHHYIKLMSGRTLTRFVKNIIGPAILVGLLVGLDSWFYGEPTLTPYNFFKINVGHNLAKFYGIQPIFWYFTHAVIPIMGPLFLVSFCGMVTQKEWLDTATWPILLNLTILSWLEHKEMRFIQPILPLLYYRASQQLARWYNSPPTSNWVILLISLNIPLALYLSLVHQRGVVDVAVWLGRQDNITSAIYLMPCHSAPMYSHTHNTSISLEYLTCLPNLKTAKCNAKRGNYVEEAERFYNSPERVFKKSYSHNQCVIIFDTLLDSLSKAFIQSGHKFVKSFFHTHNEFFQSTKGRIGNQVFVYCK